MIRPAVQLRMPRFHYGKSIDTPSTKPRNWPTTSPPAIGRSSPTRRSPSERELSGRTREGIPVIWRQAGR